MDVSGRSIKNKRVRAIHSADASEEGGTAYFLQQDPYLAYQLGRNLNFREFRRRDGVFDARISNLGGPMPDGTTAKITAQNQVSCSGCHNLPQGNPGGGVTFHKDSGKGRNTPHYFGAGLTEMLALQIRGMMLKELDSNGDGWVNAAEAAAGGNRVLVKSDRRGPYINYGRPSLSNGNTGTPKLNNIFKVWYVDNDGNLVADATAVDGVETFGYNFEMIVWGWGQGPGRAALNPTNRAFLWDPWNAHGGLQAYDPSGNADADGDGISAPTLAGAIQFPISHTTPDTGDNVDPLGFSRDDDDGDGHLNEISEGDLDLGEWFMLNAPRPAFAGTEGEYRKGLHLMRKMRCTQCHVDNWKIMAEGERGVGTGDRRFIDFAAKWNPKEKRLEGRLTELFQKVGDSYERQLGSFHVHGMFADFRHHDMGKGFEEKDFGGNLNRLWRTAPLWGVGSGFPWGHDGQSLTLEDAILRHGGEARASRHAFSRAKSKDKEALLGFLRKLVLYDIETLPADINGDGKISRHHVVAGMNTGMERFNAEWLFRTPLQIQGPFTNTDGVTIRSSAGTNITEAYGEDLMLRRDSDSDGWPDVWDAAPGVAGYKDGVQ